MSYDSNIMDKDISEIIGLASLPETERVVLLRDLGELVLESALIRLVATLSKEQVNALDLFSDSVSDSQILLRHLFENYPSFEMILEEEIKAFKEEALSIFSASQ